MNKLTLAGLTLILITVTFLSCSDSGVTPNDNLEFSITSNKDLTDNPADSLILDTVKVLIKDIKLNVSQKTDSTNFKTGSFVLFLNLNSTINTISTGMIPAGTYDKVKFEIHKLEDNEPVPDPEFKDSLGRYSIVVKGKYNSLPFVYKSDPSVHQKLSFPGNLVISSSGKSNITLKISPYIWFYKNNLLLNPNDPGNKNDIDNNIKNNVNNNFKAFKDDNKDGNPD